MSFGLLKLNTTQKIILCVGFLVMAFRCFSWNAGFWYSDTALQANSLSEYITRFPAVFVVATFFHCAGVMVLTGLLVFLTALLASKTWRLRTIIIITIALVMGVGAWWTLKKSSPNLSLKAKGSGKTNNLKSVDNILGELDNLGKVLGTGKTLSESNALSTTNYTETLGDMMKEFNALSKLLELDKTISKSDALSKTNNSGSLNDLMKQLNELQKELESEK
jgi:hypothetical protein